MAQWRTSRGGEYDRDRVRNRPALHERHGRSGARFVRAIPDSCWNFPIGARHSRFVLKFPDSCARFPIGARDSQSRSWAGCRVGRFAPPPGANRSTPWGESLHPPASPGANRSIVWSIFPDWCSNFPIGAFGGLARHLHLSWGMSRAARSVATGAMRATGATVRGPLLHTRLRGFSFPFNSLSIPQKEILS